MEIYMLFASPAHFPALDATAISGFISLSQVNTNSLQQKTKNRNTATPQIQSNRWNGLETNVDKLNSICY